MAGRCTWSACIRCISLRNHPILTFLSSFLVHWLHRDISDFETKYIPLLEFGFFEPNILFPCKQMFSLGFQKGVGLCGQRYKEVQFQFPLSSQYTFPFCVCVCFLSVWRALLLEKGGFASFAKSAFKYIWESYVVFNLGIKKHEK